jgi:hypothetical protein
MSSDILVQRVSLRYYSPYTMATRAVAFCRTLVHVDPVKSIHVYARNDGICTLTASSTYG